MIIQDDSKINEKSIALDSSKRYLSKSTSQLCDQSLNNNKEEQVSPSSRNILDVIQEELVNQTIIISIRLCCFFSRIFVELIMI
jgi:hypothetical protein